MQDHEIYRRILGIADTRTEVVGIGAVGDGLRPVGEPAHELAVVVHRAGDEVEVAVLLDRPDRAGRDAQLAL